MRWQLFALAVSAAGCFEQPPAPASAVDASIDSSPLMCPADYTMSNGGTSQYRLVGIAVDFVTAAQDCAGDETAGPPIVGHTHLAVISDPTELDYLHNYSYGWVGLTDLVSPTDVFTWVTDEPGMSPAANDAALWAPNEPNNLSTEHCGHFDTFHAPYVNNVICGGTEMHAYVCECDTHANIPAVYGN